MRIEQFQAHPDLVARFKKLTADPIWTIVIQTLRDEHPMSYPDLRAGLPVSDDSKFVGRIQGYNFCLNNLEKMAFEAKPQTEPEALFLPEQLEKEN